MPTKFSRQPLDCPSSRGRHIVGDNGAVAVVRLIKSNTSRKLKEQFPFLKQVYSGVDGIWSEGYFASTVGGG